MLPSTVTPTAVIFHTFRSRQLAFYIIRIEPISTNWFAKVSLLICLFCDRIWVACRTLTHFVTALIVWHTVINSPKLQALVYDIFPSTSAIGSRKLSATEQGFFCWCSNSSTFVTNNSNKTRRVIYSRQQSLHQHKWNQNRLNRDGTIFFFFFFLTRGGCVSCLRACFGARLLLQSY